MLIQTALCELLGIRYPIIQAPIGGASNSLLVAAVSGAGGLGMLSGTWRSAPLLEKAIREIRARTLNPFGVNLILSFDIQEQFEVCISNQVPVISFFWGDPTPYISRVHDAQALVMHTIGTAAEASNSVNAGVDIVVAQGIEAGGHVRGNIGLAALIPAVVDAVPNIPVIAAGGIVDGRGIASALCLGASGVMLGSRFVMSRESGAHRAYQEAIVAASEEDAVYALDLFDGGWKDAPHRILKNSTYIEWEKSGFQKHGFRPGEDVPVAWLSNGEPVPRYWSDAPTKDVNLGQPEAMALYCGQGAGLLKSIEGAEEIVLQLMEETELAIERLAQKMSR
jgi:nitronate monooxygenase